VTGEVHFVDCGYSVISMPTLESLKALERGAATASTDGTTEAAE
jgi:enoyl-[acyl-carrier protein] reductase I